MDDMFVQADQPKIETIEIEWKEYRGYWERISESDYDHLYPGETGPYPGPFGSTASLWVKRLDGSPSSTFRFAADGSKECFKWVPEPSFDEGRSADSPPEGAASSTPKPELPEEEVEESRPYDVWDLLAHHDTLTAEAYELMQRKNNDYAGADGASPFKNFLHAETLGLCSAEQGMVVRLSDKLQRLAHAVSGQEMKVTDESVRDTILDIINYSVLISAYLKSKVQASS